MGLKHRNDKWIMVWTDNCWTGWWLSNRSRSVWRILSFVQQSETFFPEARSTENSTESLRLTQAEVQMVTQACAMAEGRQTPTGKLTTPPASPPRYSNLNAFIIISITCI